MHFYTATAVHRRKSAGFSRWAWRLTAPPSLLGKELLLLAYYTATAVHEIARRAMNGHGVPRRKSAGFSRWAWLTGGHLCTSSFFLAFLFSFSYQSGIFISRWVRFLSFIPTKLLIPCIGRTFFLLYTIFFPTNYSNHSLGRFFLSLFFLPIVTLTKLVGLWLFFHPTISNYFTAGGTLTIFYIFIELIFWIF